MKYRLISAGQERVVNTKWGEKKVKDIELLDYANNNAILKAGCFLGKEPFNLVIGEDYEINLITHDGRHSVSLSKIALVPKPEPIMENKEDKPDWAMKERRIVRQNALSHATEIVCKFYEDDLKNVIQAVKDIAASLEQWIYRDTVNEANKDIDEFLEKEQIPLDKDFE